MTFVDETPRVSRLYTVRSPDDEPGATAEAIASSAPGPLTEPTKAFFLSRYVDVIGPRFDMFDDWPRCFSTVIPQLALGDELVLLACLAVAARQYSLVSESGHGRALAYYNEAIHMLSLRLHEPRGQEPSVFASCLLIAHCEMVESKASDWNLHLKGTGDLIAMHGWHGMSGGLAQAVRSNSSLGRRSLYFAPERDCSSHRLRLY